MSKNWKDRITLDNIKREGMNSLYVAMGLIGATVIDRALLKVAEKWAPSIAPHVKYLRPGAQILGGLAMSVLAQEGREGDRMRLIGYGITGAGTISALRLIPWVDEQMSETPPTPPPSTNGLNGLDLLGLGDFGKTENVKQISTSEAQPITVELPDLGYTATKTASTSKEEKEATEVEFEEVLADVI